MFKLLPILTAVPVLFAWGETMKLLFLVAGCCGKVALAKVLDPKDSFAFFCSDCLKLAVFKLLDVFE